MPTRTLDAASGPVTLQLPFAAHSVAVARNRLQNWLVGAGGSKECVDDARVVVSEMVANSVRHAQPLPDGKLTVSWCIDDRGLEISVTDGGAQTRPRTIDASTSALAGRGMIIIERLAASWWAEQSRSRSTVHAVLSMGLVLK